MTANAIRIGILGASGYTGAELLRLLLRHPAAEIRLLTAERQAGKDIAEVFPQLRPRVARCPENADPYRVACHLCTAFQRPRPGPYAPPGHFDPGIRKHQGRRKGRPVVFRSAVPSGPGTLPTRGKTTKRESFTASG